MMIFPEPFAEGELRLILYDDNENSVGSLFFTVGNFGGEPYIWVNQVEINEPFQRLGLGSLLVESVEDIAREVGLRLCGSAPLADDDIEEFWESLGYAQGAGAFALGWWKRLE